MFSASRVIAIVLCAWVAGCSARAECSAAEKKLLATSLQNAVTAATNLDIRGYVEALKALDAGLSPACRTAIEAAQRKAQQSAATAPQGCTARETQLAEAGIARAMEAALALDFARYGEILQELNSALSPACQARIAAQVQAQQGGGAPGGSPTRPPATQSPPYVQEYGNGGYMIPGQVACDRGGCTAL